jgi:hypothetical protein
MAGENRAFKAFLYLAAGVGLGIGFFGKWLQGSTSPGGDSRAKSSAVEGTFKEEVNEAEPDAGAIRRI